MSDLENKAQEEASKKRPITCVRKKKKRLPTDH